MKNTLMFLLVSLLLSFSLTACGGDSQQAAGDSGSNGQSSSITGDSGSSGTTGSGVTGENGSNGSAGSGLAGDKGSNGSAGSSVMPEDSLADDARDALDDAGRAVRNAVDGADRNF